MITVNKQYTDSEIISLITETSSQSKGFGILLDKFQQKVYWQVRKMVVNHDDANDITQDIFIKIWQKLSNFRGDSQLSTWIFRITYNECITFIEKKKKKNQVGLENYENEFSENFTTDVLISGDEISLKLEKAIQTLPEKQKAVFNLKYFEELTYEEISEITQTSVGALKASYHLAVKKIEYFVNNSEVLHEI